MAGSIKEVTARTKSSQYTIRIGSDILQDNVAVINKKAYDSVAVIVSSNVYSLHAAKIDLFVKSINNLFICMMDDSEENKNYRYAESFLENFINNGMTRKSLVIGIGGGVVGDFSGYLAALYMRGIAVIHVPTTLLAMIDSSLGGKTAVNLNVGKNIIGAFHQPSLVISDVDFLKTLDPSEFTNGLAESLKHGLIGDDNSLEILKKFDLETVRSDSGILQSLIYHSVVFKTTIVEQDEKEGSLRAILNYGHTVGHAIESLMEYKNISHGEAVAIGMKVKNIIAQKMDLLSADEVQLIDKLIGRYHLIHQKLDLNADDIVKHLVYDKKNAKNKINFVLLKGIGNPVINQHIDNDLLVSVLKGTI